MAGETLLAQPVPEIAETLVEDGEWMRDLRQNTPFAGVLTPEDRWKIIREVRYGELPGGNRKRRGVAHLPLDLKTAGFGPSLGEGEQPRLEIDAYG